MRPLRLAVAAAFASFVGLAVAVAVLSSTGAIQRSTFDVTNVYRPFGELIAGGGVPYRDAEIEYPPGALITFVAPALVSDSEAGYRSVFVLLMLVCVGLALGVVAWVLAAVLGATGRTVAVRVALATAMLAALGSVSLTRFDVFPALLVVLALALILAGRERLGAVALGAAIAAKLFPVVLLPLLAAWSWQRRGRRSAAEAVVLALGVALGSLLPFLVLAPQAAIDSVTRQLERPLELESLGAVVVILGDWLGLGEVEIVGSFGSTNVAGWGVGIAETLSALAGLALLLVVVLRFARGPAEPVELVTATTAAIAVLLATAKVLSAQFLVWLVPLVVLVPGRRGDAARALFAGACVLTAVWFPELFRQVTYEDEAAPLALVMVRNALLVLVALLLVLPVRASRSAPARSPLPAQSPGRS